MSMEPNDEISGGAAMAEVCPEDFGDAFAPAGRGDNVHPVRRLREQLLMTREELAARAGVSLRTIWSVEHGRSCRTPTKRRILKALGVAKTRHHEIFPEG